MDALSLNGLRSRDLGPRIKRGDVRIRRGSKDL